MRQTDRFTQQELEDACDDLGSLKYFPRESRGAIMLELARMCPSRAALGWLMTEVRARLTEWPGLAELRGILCTRFDPADGRDYWSTLPGYRAPDMEAKHLEQHEQLKAGGYLSPASQKWLALAGQVGTNSELNAKTGKREVESA